MAQSNTTFSPSPTDNGGKAREGSKTLRVDYDFSGGIQAYTTDIVQIKQQGKMSLLQSVYIDNVTGGNNQPVVLSVSGTNQSISVPANFQGVFPLFVTDRAVFGVSSAGNGKVSIFFQNFEVAPFMWQGIAIPLNVGGTLAVADAILDATVSNNQVNVASHIAPSATTDRSGTMGAGGVSQQAAAANPARQGWLLQNMDETIVENLYVKLGSAAQINTPGSFTVFAGGGSIQGVGTASINVISATIGHKYSLVEW